ASPPWARASAHRTEPPCATCAARSSRRDSWTSTSICASRATRTKRPSRRGRARLWRAGSRPCAPCPTRTPSPTTRPPSASSCAHRSPAGSHAAAPRVAAQRGAKGPPAAPEESWAGRGILLAGRTGGRLHLCHLSTRGSVELMRRAKERGLRVTAEVTPHHLSLTEAACERYDTHAKMNPPLREAADVAALRQALQEGVIDCVASDHAPHAYDEKEAAFDDAPFGIVGLETAVGVAYPELGQGGAMALPARIRRMSTVP